MTVRRMLKLHKEWRGKIEVISTVKVSNKGTFIGIHKVAEPCLTIKNNVDYPMNIQEGGTCGSCCGGTAVLGLGISARSWNTCNGR